LDNGGKTTILLLLNKKFSLLSSVKPSIKAQITSFSILGFKISSWDLGGQKNYRESYLNNKEKFFSKIHSLFFVIDIQKKDKFYEALMYLEELVDIVLELNPNFPQFVILFHKYDPDIKNKREIIENIDFLETKIKKFNKNINFSFYKTSIYDEPTLLTAFSEGAISITQKSKLMQSLLKEYTKKTFSSAAIILDEHSFIIASRATKEYYEQICKSIATYLAYTMEKLENWDVEPLDIITNIQFPYEKNNELREGIIFFKKFNFNGEKLYLIVLCLNKKIKDTSYNYLPRLANNLKNLFESFD